jgi:hypothetical protein
MTDSLIKEKFMEDYVGIDVGTQSVVACVRRGGRTIDHPLPQGGEGKNGTFVHKGKTLWRSSRSMEIFTLDCTQCHALCAFVC